MGVLCLRRHEGQRDRALLQDAPCLHRRRRRGRAHQHDLRHHAGAAPGRSAHRAQGGTGAARHRRQPDRFLPAALDPAVRPEGGAKESRAAALGKKRSRIDPVRQRHVPDRECGEIASSIPTMLKSVSDVVGKVSDPKSRDSLASMASPPTILNKTISSERSFAGTSISLSRAKALAKTSGGKLNDVVLALSSGVVRRYLISQGALPSKSLTAAVPISLREEGNADANNQVFGMICAIATNVGDPKTRLETIIAQSTKSKEMSHPLRALMPQVSNLSMLGAPIVTQILALLYSRSNLSDVLPPAANITVSNVPGPRQTLYAAGAELLHIFPVSISTHGIALNITVQSYRDQLDFGFIAGANIIPHVQILCDMLPVEFEALEAAFAPPPSMTRAAE
nr:WS/DGAT domain-containing protein [Bradyrhizobium sp. sGM-13]